MEYPLGRIFLFFILLYYNVAVFSQNVPAGLALLPLQLRNTEGVNLVVPSPRLCNTVLTTSGANGVRSDGTCPVWTGVPECQRAMLLQDGIGPLAPPTSVPPQILPTLSLSSSVYNGPIPQGPLGSVPLNPSYLITAAPILPGIPAGFPLPQPSAPLNLYDLPPINCPITLSQFMSFQQQQIPLDNFLPNPILPEVCLPPSNFQQNLPEPRPGPATLVSFSQPRFSQVDYTSAPSLPEVCPPFSTFQMANYPELPPGTATIIPSVPNYPVHNSNYMSVLSDVNLSQQGYQVTVLPPVSSVQTVSESVAYPMSSYSYVPVPSNTDNPEQLLRNLQINFPEQSGPMTMPFPPPFPPAPIIVMKSGSSWKNWLPTLLISLFSNSRGGQECGGCCCCSTCDCSDNVYIPYPIPVPTNNPIILSGNSRNDDKSDGYDVEVGKD